MQKAAQVAQVARALPLAKIPSREPARELAASPQQLSRAHELPPATQATRRRVGRPKLSGSLKSIRLRESVFNLWKDRKEALGFSGRAASEFAV